MDFIVELPPTQDGYNAIVVFVDRLSKMVHLQPTKTTATAVDVANIFFNTVFWLHGLPRMIVSDRDPKFTSKFWQMLFKLIDTKLTLSTAFHPQTDGQTERANWTLEQYLRAFINYKQDNWASLLPITEFTINNAKNASTGFSPFYLANGCHPVTPTSLINPRSCLIPAASNYIDHLQTVLATAKDNLRTAQDHQANYANRHRREELFTVGDQVMLSAANIELATNVKRPSHKLLQRSLGPYEVIKVISDVAYKLNLPATLKIHPVFHVSLLTRYHASNPDIFPGRIAPPPPPTVVDTELEYEVETILDKRTFRRQVQYLVKWAGYPAHDASWEPTANLSNSMDLITDFERQQDGVLS
jgi:Chromo (CHRromatin Organisation MOdifier) domain